MIGRVRRQLGRLRRLPRDLFVSLAELRQAVDRQNNGLEHEVRALSEQLPQISDALLQILLRTKAADEARAPAALANGAAETVLAQLSAWRAEDRAQLDTLLQRHDAQGEAMSRQLEQIVEVQRKLRPLLPSHLWSPEIGERVRQTLSILRPYQTANVAKIRLGRANDGGYVMLDDFPVTDAVVSLGVGWDVSWDLALAERGLKILMCDDTIDAPPENHALFTFRRTRVAPADGDNTTSLTTLLRMQQSSGARRIILKMDIEGDEWACLAATDSDALATCSQIVCEFHDLHKLADPVFSERARSCLNKLSGNFFVCHVHGNNCSDVSNVGNVTVPDVLEVTFANRAFYQPVEGLEIFPTAIDMPNQPGRADIFLGAFRFGM